LLEVDVAGGWGWAATIGRLCSCDGKSFSKGSAVDGKYIIFQTVWAHWLPLRTRPACSSIFGPPVGFAPTCYLYDTHALRCLITLYLDWLPTPDISASACSCLITPIVALTHHTFITYSFTSSSSCRLFQLSVYRVNILLPSFCIFILLSTRKIFSVTREWKVNRDVRETRMVIAYSADALEGHNAGNGFPHPIGNTDSVRKWPPPLPSVTLSWSNSSHHEMRT
jgi:hypothetical protein